MKIQTIYIMCKKDRHQRRRPAEILAAICKNCRRSCELAQGRTKRKYRRKKGVTMSIKTDLKAGDGQRATAGKRMVRTALDAASIPPIEIPSALLMELHRAGTEMWECIDIQSISRDRLHTYLAARERHQIALSKLIGTIRGER